MFISPTFYEQAREVPPISTKIYGHSREEWNAMDMGFEFEALSRFQQPKKLYHQNLQRRMQVQNYLERELPNILQNNYEALLIETSPNQFYKRAVSLILFINDEYNSIVKYNEINDLYQFIEAINDYVLDIFGNNSDKKQDELESLFQQPELSEIDLTERKDALLFLQTFYTNP